MKLLFTLLTMTLLYSSTATAQIETMQLQGQGYINFFGFVKVYNAYLYTDQINSEKDILSPEVSKCLKLRYDVSLTKENFIEGANTVIFKQHPKENIAKLKDELNQLHNSYQPVEEGDIYTLCYDAASTITTLSLNNSKLTAVASKEFSRLYFGIWLGGDEPIDEDLRNDLLNLPN